MIKVIFLYENLKVGGAEQLLLTTVKYIDRDVFTPVVYCIGEKGDIGTEIEKRGTKVTALGMKPKIWNFPAIARLVKIFKKERPDILHTHLFYANYLGRVAAILAGVRVVIVTEHGTYSNFKRFYHHFIDYALSFNTSKIIAVSEAVKGYLSKYTRIPEHKMTVIYNAVDFEYFDPACAKERFGLRSNFGYSGSGPLLGCVSNLAPWKGQMTLLKAFVEIRKHFPRVKLCIVGRDACGAKEELLRFAKANNCDADLHFLGERRDIPEILRMLDIFVFPSFTEGLGISLLEAMYMGLPSVASRTEGVLEIIENNRDGITVAPGDHERLAENIVRLLNDRAKMESMGVNAREKVKMLFSPEKYITQLQAVYNGSLAS